MGIGLVLTMTTLISLNAVGGINLAGSFNTRTNVQSEMEIALDVAGMREADSVAEREALYRRGKNSQKLNGTSTLVTISLASLSLESASIMSEDPTYNYYRTAFRVIGFDYEDEDYGKFDDSPAEHYANTIVEDLFDLNSEDKIETEAALVMNVWMTVTHFLHKAVRTCTPNAGSTVKNTALEALDKAAAYWIGVGQEEGDNDSGNMLYNLAEKAGEHFGQDDSVTRVNRNIVSLMTKMQEDIDGGLCGTTEEGYQVIRKTVNDIISQMTVPFVQNLLHYLKKNDDEFIELYTLALLPQINSCSPASFAYFIKALVINVFTNDKFDEVLNELRAMYSCFGISCEDVGAYRTDEIPACSDEKPTGKDDDLWPAIAGYTPRTDVSDAVLVDRDLLQMQLLMERSAYGAALDLYRYGRNAKNTIEGDDSPYLTLRGLATGSQRTALENTTFWSAYKSYYETDQYPDTMITDALLARNPFDDPASPSQRYEIVFRTLQGMVSYQAGVQELVAAKELCVGDDINNDSEASTAPLAALDRGFAYLVGSLEGHERHGSEFDYGVLLYALAKELCTDFDDCAGSGDSEANEEFVNFLDRGQEAIMRGDCSAYVELLDDILLEELAVPLVQGTLHYASENEDLEVGSTDGSVGTLHAISRAIVPLVATAADVGGDKTAEEYADILDRNTVFSLSSKLVPNGVNAVFNALAQTVNSFSDCRDIGSYDGFDDFCSLQSGDGDEVTDSEGNVGGLDGTNDGDDGTDGGDDGTDDGDDGTDDGDDKEGSDETGVSFGGSLTQIVLGRYEFTTNGKDYGRISQDVKAIMASQETDDARDIYMKGSNVEIDFEGTTKKVTLASMSLNASVTMAQDPLFNIYRYAFKDEPVFVENGDGRFPDSTYANTIITKAFEIADDVALAGEATVVVNIWMEIVHQLQLALSACQSGGDHLPLDIALAYWIGDDEGAADDDTASSMYHIAETAASYFELESGEAVANSKLIELFHEASVTIDSCSATDIGPTLELRQIVYDIISMMTVPLVQNLIFYLGNALEGTKNFENLAELYALSFIPQIAACNPDTYNYLKDELIDQDLEVSHVEDIMAAIQSMYPCMGITCDDIGSPKGDESSILTKSCGDQTEPTIIAGFEPTTAVEQYKRVDRDILRLKIFLEFNAKKAAKDLYLHGHNSRRPKGSFRSLHELATNSDRDQVKAFTAFKTYFKRDDYADKIILDALEGNDPFNGASLNQIREVVIRSVQGMVIYMEVMRLLQMAVDNCPTNANVAQHSWEKAVAYYAGSLEGTERGGSTIGLSLYSLAKEFCVDFDTCAGSGDAEVNEELVNFFKRGSEEITDGDCPALEINFILIISSLMDVPLIQGTLHYATTNGELGKGTQEASLGTGHALSRAILPLIASANATDAAKSAQTVDRNMVFQLDSEPVADGAVAVFDALTAVLPGMNADCKHVGDSQVMKRDVCPVNATDPDTPTVLAKGLYVTTTYVEDRSKIALDVEQIGTQLRSGNMELAKHIYTDGLNSDLFNDAGFKVGQRALADFSLNAGKDMAQEAPYNLFRYALRDENSLYDKRSVDTYADTIVMRAFENTKAPELAAEAVVALNVWMHVVHELYQTVDRCKQKKLKDDDGVHSIDEAAAYYIGDSQQAGDSKTGHLLYALAEKMGELFGQERNGQALVNTRILSLLNKAKREISYVDACTAKPDTAVRLRTIANDIVAQMTVPLLQSVIYYLEKNDRERVMLYAKAVVPLVAGCSPTTFRYLRDKLINGKFNAVDSREILERLESTYSCLGLTCNDVGTIAGDSVTACVDPDDKKPMAGYVPATDVREFARLDLDLLHISIFMEMGAHDLVDDYYRNGKHTFINTFDGKKQPITLHGLAITGDREIVPRFDAFERFYSDFKYGDTMVQEALNPSMDLFSEQRKDMVVMTLQYLVVYMATLQKMYDAIDDCESIDQGRNELARLDWDRAAALLIGSLEGEENGGNNDGIMLHGLAKSLCEDFSTCTDQTKEDSRINVQLMTLLYSGRAETAAKNCPALTKTVTEIEAIMQVPLIQGTLHYSVLNSRSNALLAGRNFARGHVLSRAILPYVVEANADAAAVIDQDMDIRNKRRREPEVTDRVFDAFETAIPSMDGVDCHLVGNAAGRGVCGETVGSASSSSATWDKGSFGLLGALVVGAVVAGVLSILEVC